MSTTEQTPSNFTSADLLYNIQQYMNLLTASSATLAISMVCSLLITITYIHLRISHPDIANRVSLRCVFMASLMNLINSIFDIAIVLIVGDTYLCRASAIISMFTRVMSAVFLALVGVNLVLVFVCNVSASAHRLECFYYPSAIIYGLLTITMPIVESSDDVISPDTDLRCYYYIHYYQFLGHRNMLWMWFYGFLFLSIVIAVICSIISLIKLMREHRALIRKWVHIASMSQTAESAQPNVEQRVKSQSNIFMRVVSRCVLYPLVPFISNIWGFIFQIYLINPKNGVPSFAFSITDAVFRCLQGFFVSIVFFSDPAITHYMYKQWSLCKEKYIDDFSQIRRYSDGQVEIVILDNEKSNHTEGSKGQPSSISIMPFSSPRKPSVCNKSKTVQQTPATDSNEGLQSNVDFETNALKRINNDCVTFNTVPMRRLSVPLSVYTRIHHTDTCISLSSSLPLPQSSISSSSITAVDFYPPSQSGVADRRSNYRILVPYKHPRLASAFHWFLVKCGFGKSNLPSSPAALTSFQPNQLSPTSDSSLVVDPPSPVHPLTE